jgi:bacillithiol biosynthesis cysteine-adding enzyme BshC
MDDKRFKKAFSPTMKKEITERKSIELVQNTQTELSGLGFRPQAFAREINLFYMENGTRERIIYENRVYRINNTELTFSEDELINQIDEFPDKFSPNVVMRPIYQEFILPNIAYIGGGGEISYWVERKTQFEYFGVYFPVLIRRNSVMILTKSIQKLMDKLEVNLQALLQDENNLINLYLEKVTNADFHLLQETEQINSIFDIISEKARMIDPTLGPYALSEGQKVIKSIDAIEARLKKTIKHKEETSINQLKNLRSKLFPDGGLQERTESFLQYIVSEGFGFQEKLIEICDPLQKEFLFIYI